MSLQGPIVVVAEKPAADLTEALSAAGAFPIVEAKWADAPTAFVAVKPMAVVIAEPGPPENDSAARMLCLQIATANGPIVPAIARVHGDQEAAIPTALPADTHLPVERLIARLNSALRVRALHSIVLRRIEMAAAQGGQMPALSTEDALDDATVLIVGRGPLYPTLSVAIGERVNMVGAFSVETAATHLDTRSIDGVVVGDGLSPRMVEAFLTLLAEEPRFRDIPVAVIGEAPDDFGETLINIDHVSGDPLRLVPRMMPLVRLHAFETRLKRMLASLDADGILDPHTGLLMRDAFWRDLNRAVVEASDRSLPLSIARFAFHGAYDERAGLDGARLLTRLIRNIDFATREDDGSILIALTQTDLHHAHVVVRRIAGALRNHMRTSNNPQQQITANVTLATLKAEDNLDSLMARVMGHRVVAAE
jgi:GGDEF domain-containing protein